jgi:hypothetical protein
VGGNTCAKFLCVWVDDVCKIVREKRKRASSAEVSMHMKFWGSPEINITQIHKIGDRYLSLNWRQGKGGVEKS